MLGLEQRGVAAITAVIIVAASVGAGAATPVIVDAVDVDPDSPFYSLERLGERIRMIGGEDQMKERWGEYGRLVDRGKGLAYKSILEEFSEKMRDVVPGDVETKQETVRWMQEQMPGIGLVQLRLTKELYEKLGEDIPEASEEIENEIKVLEELEQELPVATPAGQENIRARLRLIMQHLQRLVQRYREGIRWPVNVYFDIDNVLVDVDTTVNVEVNINVLKPVPMTPIEFENKLEEFDAKLTEIQAMLEGIPENIPGGQAATQQIKVATKFRDKAVEANEENRIRKTISLLHTAWVHLRNAERILDHASDWEPEYGEEWTAWREGWENIKQELIENGLWQRMLQNFEDYAEHIKEQWREQWGHQWREQFEEQWREQVENQWGEQWKEQFEERWREHFGNQ